jgi:uncharacterized protein YdaU (DUF1376 family)
MNYYPFHIGDFRSGTVNMSRLSRWIYRDMLDVYYDTEEPLPSDFDLLCDQIGVEVEDERRIVERLLRLKFLKGEDGYRNETCDRVIAEYRARAETAKANGKLGGRPRKQSDTEDKPSGFQSGSERDTAGNPDETRSKANQEPITNNQKPKEKKTPAPPLRGAAGADAPGSSLVLDGGSTTNRDVASPVGVVFAHWQEVMGSPRSKLDSKRERVIKAAVKAGYSVDDMCKAIDGCGLSPFHMGQNDQQTKYNGLDVILRSADQIDKFIALVDSPPAPTGKATAAGSFTPPDWTEAEGTVRAMGDRCNVAQKDGEHYLTYRIRVIKASGDQAAMEREVSAAQRRNEAEYERTFKYFYGVLPQPLGVTEQQAKKISHAASF